MGYVSTSETDCKDGRVVEVSVGGECFRPVSRVSALALGFRFKSSNILFSECTCPACRFLHVGLGIFDQLRRNLPDFILDRQRKISESGEACERSTHCMLSI